MKKIVAAILPVVLMLASCNKPPTEKDNNKTATDAQQIKLKAVMIQGLPSPYFQYEYDADNFVTELSHESGLFRYKIEYKNGRISRMINNTFGNKDTLYYNYTGTNVSRIDLLKPGQGKTVETHFLYNNANRLTEATWKEMSTAVTIKKMLFQYNGQNNLSKCEIFYFQNNGLEKINTYLFDQFDDKINLTSNYLLKENHYLYLPQVQLQKNNPGFVKLTGINNDFEIVNTFHYNDTLPVLKTSCMKQTRGSGAGASVISSTSYNYY